MKILYLDTETSNVDMNDKTALLEISGIVEIDGEIKEKFTSRIKPFKQDTKEFSPFAIECHHITYEESLKSPEPSKVFDSFTAMLNKYVDYYNKTDKFILAGYNVKFDEEMLRHFFKKNSKTEEDAKYGNGFNSYFWTPSFCIMQYVFSCVLEQRSRFVNFKLGTVCNKLGVPFDDTQGHGSAYDIEKARELYLKVKGSNE